MSGAAGMGAVRPTPSSWWRPSRVNCSGEPIAITRARRPRIGMTRSGLRLLLQEGLRASGLSAENLALLAGNDPRKIALAQTIRRATAISSRWLAERLAMRSFTP